MTRPLTTMEDAPFSLGVPLTEPEPVPGCAQCRHWDGQRSAARRVNDGARVSDCNVHIRRHPH